MSRFACHAAAVAALVFAAPGSAGVAARLAAEPLPVPALTLPADGATVDAVPVFAWEPSGGADRYDFQIAGDAGFTVPVLGAGDQVRTRNTRATLKKTVPNGTYWWRVRSVSGTGDVSAWSPPRSFEHAWSAAPALLSPVTGADVVYPNPLVLRWASVPRARTYAVSIATDPALASLVGGKAFETDATSFAYPGLLTPGTTYYWGVTPLDGARHRGAPSVVSSFRWLWPSTMATTPRVRDLAEEHTEIFDPEFSWDPVPGAARYEVEMWSSDQPQLKVCCDGTSIGTSLAPTTALKDNTYFWHVRGIDAAGHAGAWNEGPAFTKEFGKGDVQNLHMRDNVDDPGSDVEPATEGYQTRVPIVTWDPFPGASSYDVEVAPFVTGRCNWTASVSHWQSTTATTAWTPLGVSWNGRKPYDDPRGVVADFASLVVGASYCVRVRPRDVDSSGAGSVTYGDYTYLNGNGPAFQWLGYPAGEEDCTPWPGCDDGYVEAESYLEPARGVTTTRMPLFTWRPLAGNKSYFVLVAKDPSFHTIVDYAFTQVPAYAPRGSFGTTTYQDETTLYYWAVLPAVEFNGDLASGNPLAAHASDFQKMSGPPTLRAPANGARLTDHPRFAWTPVQGARRYRVQVSQDPAFTTILDDVLTDATGYTSKTTYPSDAVVHWRVRGEDDRLHAMTWSAPATFQRPLPEPVLSPTNPLSGDFVPTVTWSPVQGAVSYDLDVVQTSGMQQLFPGFRAAAFTPSSIYGTGVWKWRVRANFEKSAFATVAGPYTNLVSFTRVVREPPGANTNAGPRHVVLGWQPKDGPGNGIKEYRVQISTRDDFSTLVEDERTENTSYAPLLTHSVYLPGGTFYWRVAAVDGAQNSGAFTETQGFTIPPKSTPQACSDLLDNDGDGKTDYPADPGCSSTSDNDETDPAPPPPPPPPPACSDLRDNDGDGKTDYPADLGCSSTSDNDETDPAPPPPPPPPACSDLRDNDGDGKTDYPADPGCSSSSDDDEADPLPAAPPAPPPATPLPVPPPATPLPPPPPAPPAERKASRTTVSVTRTRRTVKVRGRVTPSRRGRVLVTLFRKRNGAFVRVASKTPVLTSVSAYAASFGRARAGTCKVTARFGGDSDHLPSQASATFRC